MGRLTWSLLLLTLALAVSLAWWLTSSPADDGDAAPRGLARDTPASTRAAASLPSVANLDTRPVAQDVGAHHEPVALVTPVDAPSAAAADAPTLRVSLHVLAEGDVPPSTLSVSAAWVEDDGRALVDEQEFVCDTPDVALDLRRPTPTRDNAEADDDLGAVALLELRVGAPELQTGVVWVQVPAELDALDVELRLPEGALWRGRVVDPEGAPVAGAHASLQAARSRDRSPRVRVEPPGVVSAGGTLSDLGELRDAPPAARTRAQPLRQDHFSCVSDEAGALEFGPVALGDATLHVSHRDYLTFYERAVPVGLARAAEPYTVVLERGFTLRGTLVDPEGNVGISTPIRVVRQFESALLAKGIHTSAVFPGMVQWDGEFEITGLEPGEYELRVAAPGFAPHVERVVVPTAEPLRVVLGARCERRVEFAGGLRFEPRDEVSFITLGPEDQHGRRHSRERDLRVLPPDDTHAEPYLLVPNDLDERDDHALAARGAIPHVLRPLGCDDTLVVTLRPEGTLRGRVLDAHGDGVAGVYARIDRGTFSAQPDLAPFARPQGAVSDADGRWSLPHWGPGEVSLAFQGEGWLPVKRGVEITTFGEQSVGDDTLERTRRVVVEVLTPNGEPAPALRVALGFESLAPTIGEPGAEVANLMISGAEAVTDIHGRAVFDELPAGRGWVGLLRPAQPPDRSGRRIETPGDRFPHVRPDATDAQRVDQVRAWADALGALAAPFETGAAPETRVTLVAHPRPVLRGSVSGLGALLEGARVALIQPSDDGTAVCRVIAELSLGARGEFTSPPLDPRPTLLALQAPWLGPLVVRFLEPRLGSDEHVHLKVVGQTLRVRVVDAGSGDPVPDAEMSLSRMGGNFASADVALEWGLPPGTATELFKCVRAPPGRLGVTRADGGFEIPGLRALGPGMVYGLGVRVRGWQPHYVQLRADDWPDDGVIELRLERAGRLHVTVLAQEGNTEVFEVHVANANTDDEPLVIFRRGGTFQLDDLAPGAYALELRRMPDADPPSEVLDRAQVVLTPSTEPVEIVLDAR